MSYVLIVYYEYLVHTVSIVCSKLFNVLNLYSLAMHQLRVHMAGASLSTELLNHFQVIHFTLLTFGS